MPIKELIVGVVSGLTTAFILLLASAWMRKVAVPWIENIISRGVRIDGIWKTTMEIQGIKKSEIVQLAQRGHKIAGTITYPEDTKGKSHTYLIEGDFYDNVLTALMKEVGKARLDRGAIVMTLKQGTSQPEMVGLGVWFDGEKPCAVNYRWERELE